MQCDDEGELHQRSRIRDTRPNRRFIHQKLALLQSADRPLFARRAGQSRLFSHSDSFSRQFRYEIGHLLRHVVVARWVTVIKTIFPSDGNILGPQSRGLVSQRLKYLKVQAMRIPDIFFFFLFFFFLFSTQDS